MQFFFKENSFILHDLEPEVGGILFFPGWNRLAMPPGKKCKLENQDWELNCKQQGRKEKLDTILQCYQVRGAISMAPRYRQHAISAQSVAEKSWPKQ